MTPQPRPIPALYCVYILRSTVRHSSLYIGSTPNPPRRLSQHNGVVKGGAVRTSRNSLRPWEMVALVSGFASSTAALKFEWALTNPHTSLHIPSESRLAFSTQRKRNGQPKRPPKSLSSILSNLHLLLSVPSFARWPLRVHFFKRDVHAAWGRWCGKVERELRGSLPVVTDFGEDEGAVVARASASEPLGVVGEGLDGDGGGEEVPTWGIYGLPLDYAPLKEYVAKGQDIFVFERQGSCVVCKEEIDHGEGGLHAVCSNEGCEGVGHLRCWGRYLLKSEEGGGEGAILPVGGRCPRCKGEVHWGTMMKELTLRVRGQKEVENLLKVKRKRAPRKKTAKTKETGEEDG
ncbi:Slx4p interacting protein [Podospora pseudocomata]|uniref:Slx4p interacting protein n=1 Tax=Podospora pseudocomata TaxID=2093779 RepID=A0ABR0GLX3_9PEZI|nr:Slx4p interacting protein [Podospora pseudocomata]